MTTPLTILPIQHATLGESHYAGLLVDAILNYEGHTISVNDGEVTTVKRSRNREQILLALCTTGIDDLLVRDANGDFAGWFHLIWGNDPDGCELVADFTDNDFCNTIWNQIFKA